VIPVSYFSTYAEINACELPCKLSVRYITLCSMTGFHKSFEIIQADPVEYGKLNGDSSAYSMTSHTIGLEEYNTLNLSRLKSSPYVGHLTQPYLSFMNYLTLQGER